MDLVFLFNFSDLMLHIILNGDTTMITFTELLICVVFLIWRLISNYLFIHSHHDSLMPLGWTKLTKKEDGHLHFIEASASLRKSRSETSPRDKSTGSTLKLKLAWPKETRKHDGMENYSSCNIFEVGHSEKGTGYWCFWKHHI